VASEVVVGLDTSLGPLQLKNPVIAGSSEFTMTEGGIKACVDAGAAAVVAKSVNEDPAAARQLDIAAYALLDDAHAVIPWAEATPASSLFNRSGLAQSTLDDWLDMLDCCDRYARERGSFVIGSVTVAQAQHAADIARAMSEVVGCVEINLSAPHGREVANSAVRQVQSSGGVAEYSAAVRAAVDCPLIVKLSGQTEDVVELARQAANAGADVVAMIGRFGGFMPDLQTQRPVLGSWGAIGGRWSLPLALYWVSKTHVALGAAVPIIGTNGARDGDDVLRFLLSGARAVEMCSAVLTHGPLVLTAAVDRVRTYLTDGHVDSVSDLVGVATRSARTYEELGKTIAGATAFPWQSPT
jgi:dihydroorotate dehydrogenase